MIINTPFLVSHYVHVITRNSQLFSLLNPFSFNQTIFNMSFNLIESATNSEISRIVELHVSADSPASIPPLCTAMSRRTTLLPPSLHIAGSNSSICCVWWGFHGSKLCYWVAGCMQRSLTIQFIRIVGAISNIEHYLVLPGISDYYHRVIFRKTQQHYRLDIERVRLSNICHVQNALVAILQGVFQVPVAPHCDYFDVANSNRFFFVDVL